MKQQNILGKLIKLSVGLALGVTLTLTGCGGGGSGGSGAVATPAVSTATLPPAPAGTPADAGTAGTLPFLAYSFASTSVQDVAISGSGTTSVMTFTNPAFTLTGATSGSPVWSANTGLVHANGNIVSYCSTGSQTVSSTQQVNMSFMNGHRIFLSANTVAVSDFTEMKGRILTKFDCAGSLGTLTFNATGDTVTNVDATGTAIVTAADMAQLTSVNGVTNSDGSNNTIRGFKYTNNGVTTYFIVVLAKYSGGANSGGHVALYTSNP